MYHIISTSLFLSEITITYGHTMYEHLVGIFHVQNLINLLKLYNYLCRKLQVHLLLQYSIFKLTLHQAIE